MLLHSTCSRAHFLTLSATPPVDFNTQSSMSFYENSKDILRKNYEYLVGELNVSLYLDAFFSEKVISFGEKENLWMEQTKHDRARKLLDLLLEDTTRKFFKILKTRQDKQPHIYGKLVHGMRQDDHTDHMDGVVAENSCSLHQKEP